MGEALLVILRARLRRHAARVIHQLRRMSSTDWQLPDSSCRSLWDHWKLELQEDFTVAHDEIEQEVERCVRRIVDTLPSDEIALLTLADADRADLAGFAGDKEFVADRLMQAVNAVALDEPHRAAVQRQLDDGSSDRFDLDRG